ncbi:TadG family pilus assembly protein [Bradyrhizobium sp. CB1650]|uniref:pilus assembly protein TadG-related protein n=1 Tax=Bradyrhizobium sp. CB1650 TaxID=3039153 RepID=UPI0024349778|nr:pilus assembly protein TadG-related protein [Bradyrhizobium sp. CB1650]WGD53022.1 TadG family pilus assembly protein [Bradyrhizobium sp. CB1650]
MERRLRIHRFIADTRGNFTLMGAGLMTLVIGCTALGVDVGAIFTDKRKAQSAADLAAIVAASNLTNAYNAASATVVKNNYPANSLVSVDLGTYTPDPTRAPQARFVTPATGTANAARVTLRTQTPLYFARYITGSSQFTINTQATASSTAFASFAIGSRLVSINGGLLNALLGGMLGTSFSLSAMDYQSLVNARIDAFDFLSALATRANLTGVSYDTLLSGNVKLPDAIAAALAAQQATNGASSATIALSHQITAPVALGLPGIAGASVVVTIGERPVGSSWLAVGTQGASVHTAQTRILLMVQIGGSGIVPAINLPLYVEIAQGTATLNAISCNHANITNSTVTLGVTPGLVDAWIGNVSMADMTNFTSKPNPPAAVLVNVGGLNVSGRAHAAIGNTSPTSVDFNYVDIQSQLAKTISTRNFTSSLTSSLLGDLSLSVNGVGLPIPGLTSTVSGILAGSTSSIDQLVASVLSTLGVGVGQADVWVPGIRCDGAVLVN